MSVVFHPLILLHNKSGSRFNSGSIVVVIYDAVNGAQVFKNDKRDKLHMFDSGLTRGCEVIRFVFFPRTDSAQRGFGGMKYILLLNNKQ